TEFIGDRGYQVLDDNGLYDAMADASQEFNRGRARTINYLSVIAQASPMIGLLGTVSGMIKAFDQLGGEGMGDPASLATNISEALFTTAAGLVIAVPSLFVYYFFRDRLAHYVAVTDKEAYRLLNSLRRAIVAKHSGGASPAAQPQAAPAPAPAAQPDPAPQAYQAESPAPAPPAQPEAPAPPPAAPEPHQPQPYQPQPYKPSSEQ
ncbi:MAG: MotA/TolQ/ExbB proton channel family protein, partial [Verrucomicrobiota bacterium]